jgi:hypothetical protein
MPIIQKEKIKIKWNRSNRKYYTEKGYTYTCYGEEFEIDYHDLPPQSRIEVLCECDFCFDTFKRAYVAVRDKIEIACPDKRCIVQKTKSTLFRKFGVTNIAQVPGIKEKIEKTNIERYGAKNVFGSEHGKKKIVETNMKKRGVPYVTMDPEVQEKMQETTLKNFGVKNPFSSPKIIEKIEQTYLQKYGVKNVSQSKEIREKARKTFYQYGTSMPVSKSQKHYQELFNGVLEYHEYKRFMDIAFPEKQIFIECDFGGHFSFAKMKNIDEKSMFCRDRDRDKKLLNNGWKSIRYICRNDIFPTDLDMLYLNSKLLKLLEKTNINRICIDLNFKFILFEPNWKVIPLENLL